MTIESSDPGHHPHCLFDHNHFKKMTREQFDKWLIDVDSNKDGIISQKELYAALKVLGLHMKHLKAWIAIKAVDRNHNKGIDGSVERQLLIDYAALKVLGLHMKHLKAWIAIKAVDRNHNKGIDGSVERQLLIDYAAKHWDIIVGDNS